MLNTFSKTILFLMCLSSMAHAQLVPIDEQELSDMTGQAFFNIDRSSSSDFDPDIASDQNLDFTKLTFGLDVKTLLTSDLLEFGNYTRDGVDGSDIKINDFALGMIGDDGKIIPFEVTDPFIELAFEDVNGVQNLAGVRLGFGGANGKLTGDIESLTGNINVNIVGTAEPIRDSTGWFNRTLLSAAGVSDSTTLSATAELVDGATGEASPVRAESVGLVNGVALDCDDGCGLGGLSGALLSLFESDGCDILGIETCFPLSSYKSLDIGSSEEDAEGLFLSFQTQAITWYDSGQGTETVKGAFFNIPNGGITVDFEEAFDGTARVRTKYVDPYFGGN
jgi:hypothetical protein